MRSTKKIQWSSESNPKMISVTNVVKRMVDPYCGVPLDALKRAAEIGRYVHQAVEMYEKGILNEKSLDPDLEPYLAGWKHFVRDSKYKFVQGEYTIMNETHHFIGHPDQIGECYRSDYAGIRSLEQRIIEIKTTSQIDLIGHRVQAAVYSANTPNEPPPMSVYLRKGGTYDLGRAFGPTEIADHCRGFLGFLTAYRWTQEYVK